MLIQRPAVRPIPDLTPLRSRWLQNLEPGDLAHFCNGGSYDFYPLLLVVRTDASRVFTRFLDDFFIVKNIVAMKRRISQDKELNLCWSRENGAGLREGREHNFILPPVDDAIAKAVECKAITMPTDGQPNLNAINQMLAGLKAKG